MLLVAVSGGIDSMCLAQKVCLEGRPFAVAHCNFSLRGEESDADEAFVTAWAQERGIPIHVKRFDTKAFAQAEGISIEMAARRLRYHWFGELCREHGYSAVAVAHNANDNAETLLLNLLRGTGLKGITGMKAHGYVPDPAFADIPLLRPLLGMTREEIEAWAREHGLSWREDSSNAVNDVKRNKLRNLVFPVFRSINPSFVQTLNRDMQRFADELEGTCRTIPHGMPGQAGHDEKEPCEGQGAIRRPAGPGICRQANTERRKGRQGFRGQVPPDDARVAMDSGISPLPTQAENIASSLISPVTSPVPPGSTGGPMITQEPWDGTESVVQPRGVLIMDANKAGEYVEGYWEPGDWIKPLGAPGKKKLQDWFTDHHIGTEEKHTVLLLKSAADPHHVLAIAGYAIDHSVRVDKSTRRIVRISAKNA